MSRFIVTTTIHEPTEALRRFAQIPGWRLVVVGDLKTPHETYNGLDCDYLSPGLQQEIDRPLSDLIDWNCIQRRNMGFVYAARNGAELVATVDDDNVPNERWGADVFAGIQVSAALYKTNMPAFDPLGGHPNRWHRGYPWQWLGERTNAYAGDDLVTCDVQANLWDGDLDIDAVCRGMQPPWAARTEFSPGLKPYTSDKPMPFNSQNTILTRKALGDYFCFPAVGRFDDIYGAYVCQAHGHRVVFGEATVEQVRNPHDLTQDFRDEVHGYMSCAALVTALASDREAWRRFLPERAAQAWDRYRGLMN